MPKHTSLKTVLGIINPINTIRQRAYNTINPFSDYNIVRNFKEFVGGKYMDYGNVMKVVENNNNKYLTEFGDGIGNTGVADDIWATYLQIPKIKEDFQFVLNNLIINLVMVIKMKFIINFL